MGFFFILIFIIYVCIPLLINFNLLTAKNNEIKKNRLMHAIPSIITSVFNIIFIISIFIVKDVDTFLSNKYLFIIPGLLLLACLISYFSGKRTEKQMELAFRKEEMDDANYIYDKKVGTLDISYLNRNNNNNNASNFNNISNLNGSSNVANNYSNNNGVIDFGYLEQHEKKEEEIEKL